MIFYTKNGKKINIKELELLKDNRGTQGIVYKYGKDSCLKVYHESYFSKIEEGIFDIIKSLDLKNFYKLYDLLFDEQMEKILAYTMKYYESTNENILFLPVDYTMDNFNNIYKSISILAENRILVEDLFYKNVILGQNEITIIDIDSYRFEDRNSIELIKDINSENIVYMMKTIYKEELYKLGINLRENQYYQKKLDNLFSYSYLMDAPKVLAKRLENIKRPIEYFKEN